MDSKKWQKYLRIDNEDFSGSPEVDEGARGLHMELINRLPGGHSALDVGCGTGWSTEELSKKYDIVAGISIQRAEVEHARKNHMGPKTTFHWMDMHELTLFEDGEFAAVYMREVLEHSIAPFIALCEANRVLETGGNLCVNIPPYIDKWINWHCHYIVFTDKQLESLLVKTGFKIYEKGQSAGAHNYFFANKIEEIKF